MKRWPQSAAIGVALLTVFCVAKAANDSAVNLTQHNESKTSCDARTGTECRAPAKIGGALTG